MNTQIKIYENVDLQKNCITGTVFQNRETVDTASRFIGYCKNDVSSACIIATCEHYR